MQTKNCSAEGIPAELIAKGLKKHTLHMENKEILKSYTGYKISVFFLLSWKFLIVIGNQSNTANEMQLKKLIQNYKDCQSWKWHLLALNRLSRFTIWIKLFVRLWVLLILSAELGAEASEATGLYLCKKNSLILSNKNILQVHFVRLSMTGGKLL